MRWFPRKLEALPCRIDLPLIFDSLAGAGLAHDFHELANASKRPVERSSVPLGDGCVRDSQSQEQSSRGKILQSGGLNAESDGASAIDVINGSAEFEALGPRRNRGKQDHRIGAIGFTFPNGAKPGFFH